MKELLLQAIIGILGLWLAIKIIPEVEFTGNIKYLILAGLAIGILNFFLKPALKFITLPLRLLTFGIFGVIIDMLIIWLADVIFPELDIVGILPLLWTSIIIWGLSLVIFFFLPKTRN